jgi:hypothetical protein
VESITESLLARAIELALANVRDAGGGPFAEVVAIRAACRALGHFQLDG